jgi:hypothetical protein
MKQGKFLSHFCLPHYGTEFLIFDQKYFVPNIFANFD